MVVIDVPCADSTRTVREADGTAVVLSSQHLIEAFRRKPVLLEVVDSC